MRITRSKFAFLINCFNFFRLTVEGTGCCNYDCKSIFELILLLLFFQNSIFISNFRQTALQRGDIRSMRNGSAKDWFKFLRLNYFKELVTLGPQLYLNQFVFLCVFYCCCCCCCCCCLFLTKKNAVLQVTD